MKLRDSTRRAVSLSIFFLLGPILTIGILIGIGLRKTSKHARDVERTLSIQTGLDWKVDAVEFRSPGVVRLKDVDLMTFGIETPIFHAPEIELSFVSGLSREEFFPEIESSENSNVENDSSWSGLPARILDRIRPNHSASGFWRVLITQSELRLDAFSAEESSRLVQEAFMKLLARLSGISGEPVQIAFDEIVVHSVYDKDKPVRDRQRIRFAVGNVYRTEETFRSDWTFQIPSVSPTELQRFSIVQYRRGKGFDLGFATGTQPISCEWAAVFCSAFRRFGPGSLFSGGMIAEYRSGEENAPWNVRLNKAFLRNLDVAPFAAEYAPTFPVTGTVKGISIEHALIGPGTLSAKGWLEVVDGTIDRILFNRLVDGFQLTVNPENILETSWPAIPFDRCAISFEFLPDGAIFSPNPNQRDNLIMSRKGDNVNSFPMAVLFPPDNRRPVSYHSIMSTLAPDTAPVVPLTPGLQKILSMIPVEGFEKTPGRAPFDPNHLVPETSSEKYFVVSPDHSETLMKDASERFTVPNPQPAPASAFPYVADPYPDARRNLSPVSESEADSSPASLFRSRSESRPSGDEIYFRPVQ